MTAVTSSDRLALDGPLPRGTTVLEASAGTGKTYAIAALVTRAVAEGRCELPRILVVTFTRAATAELRDRIRRRLVHAGDHLAATAAARRRGEVPDPVGDVVLDHLTDVDDDELTRRHERLVAAARDFDAATISTIHGFTQQVLRSVGLSVDVPREVTLLEDPRELIEQVTQDVIVRRLHDRPPDAAVPPPKADHLLALAETVVNRAEARLAPTPDDADPVAADLGALGLELRADAEARKAQRAVLGYDDLLLALRDALTDPANGPRAIGVLRERYAWALVDEFQDTDPVQWDILQRAFADPHDPQRALVLIGDPKQAIYAFRGADVATYLRARADADHAATLATNYRSDPALLTALEPLLVGTRFGEEGIGFHPVDPAPDRPTTALHDPDDPAALQLRVIGEAPGGTSAPAVRAHVARDVAATVVAQLRHVRLGAERRPLRPRQVAVLVRTNAEASQVQRALREVDVPSVVNGVGSVLATDAAAAWRWLLDALERPADAGRARRVAVSPWLGWSAADLAADDEAALDHLHDQLHRWAAVLRDHGVATLERVVIRETAVAERLVGQVGGERLLTDLRHVGQLLHAAELADERGVTALRSWLASRRSDADDGALPPEQEARRLESDDEAVQILTVHRSKGLEFEVVLAPYLWSGGSGQKLPLVIDDPDRPGRLIDAGPRGRPGLDEHEVIARTERIGEALRLAYVAVTRAEHRVIVWWAKVGGSETSALARLLFRDAGAGVSLEDKVELPGSPADACEQLRTRFEGVAASVVAVPTDVRPDPWVPVGAAGSAALGVRAFDRTLDRAWSRTSYSAILRRTAHLTAAVHDVVTSETEVTVKDDEPDAPDPSRHEPATDDTAGVDERPVPLGDVQGGTAFGTLVHDVLEHVDFAADDLDAEVADVLAARHEDHGVPVDAEVLVPGLVAAIRSPLGPLAGTVDDGDGPRWRRLADLARADRLDELGFELPLAGGDAGRRGGPAVALAALADLLDRAPADGGLAADDPLRAVGYADRLRRPGAAIDLRGYLTGAIDLTLRIPGPDGPRYLIADHKTNRLAWPEPPTAWDHRPAALVHAMVDHDYPLQALLYQVALHRYLRWRDPAYDPERHLGGALYLFLRGMIGPATPEVDGAPVGVFAWRPPARLIVDVSTLLAGAPDGERAP